MRYCIVMVVLVALAQTGFADENPNLRVYLDFDPPNRLAEIDPEAGDFFDVYIVADRLSPDGGLRCLVFGLERTFGGSVVSQTMLLPGLDFGDVEDPHIGWVCPLFDCNYPDEMGLMVFGYVTYYYAGPAGVLRIIRTEVDQGIGVDCIFEVDYFCIGGNAGVGMSAPAGEAECFLGPTPVNAASWGAVKSLYR